MLNTGIQLFSKLDSIAIDCYPFFKVAIRKRFFSSSLCVMLKILSSEYQRYAIKEVKKIAAREKIDTIETITSACHTGLSENSVNVVLLYDIFHDLSEPEAILQELHRVIIPGGALSFSDHHMKEQDILTRVTAAGMFQLSKKGKKTYHFSKIN